jgi:hypothetical protein
VIDMMSDLGRSGLHSAWRSSDAEGHAEATPSRRVIVAGVESL